LSRLYWALRTTTANQQAIKTSSLFEKKIEQINPYLYLSYASGKRGDGVFIIAEDKRQLRHFSKVKQPQQSQKHHASKSLNIDNCSGVPLAQNLDQKTAAKKNAQGYVRL
jgi:hypothetical protein